MSTQDAGLDGPEVSENGDGSELSQSGAGWRRACALSDISDCGALRVPGAQGDWALVRVGDQVFAIADRCTHAEASLSEGDVDPDELLVECPRHGAAFDLQTGEAMSLPATKAARTVPVDIRDGSVWIDDTNGDDL